MDAGADVHVLAPAAPGLADRATIHDITVERVRYARDDRQTLAYTGTMAETVRGSWSGRFALLGLLRHLRRATQRALVDAHRAGAPFDAVHAHWWFPAGLALWGAGFGRAGAPRLVITMHGSDVRLARNTPLAHPVMRRVLAQADTVTAVSRWLADEAMAIAPGVTVRVAPMPVDITQFTPPETDAHATARTSRLLFVGRLNAQKGVADLLDALAHTRHAVSCDIIGDGPDREALHQRARTLGIDARVRWHGALPSHALSSFYRGALATVMPSREEGLGLVAVESQLSGTPVIAYASGGLPDVVDPAAGGTLVPSGDIPAFARAIDALADAPEQADALGAAGRQRVFERFSPVNVARRYLAWYSPPPSGDHD